ncbi:MAG: Gldg family protein [Candidatus Omnitrophica bacterium]|nr:Gldg family protein [Candidatus Omnitrophota bacterium]
MSKRKSAFSNFHFAIFVLTALLIAVFAYLIARNYRHRFDLSEGKVYSLAPQSLQVLEALQSEPIRVYAFFREDLPSKAFLEDLLKEYAYRHPRFHYEFYDPDRVPGKVKQFGIDTYGTTVIEVKGKREKTNQITEEAVTNILAKLLREEAKRLTFTKEHGGPSLAEEKEVRGYGLLKKKLVDFNYEVQETILLRDKISRGTDLLVLGGPKVDLLLEELDLIRKYVDGGGNLLALIDPVNPGEGKNLEQFLKGYGIQLGSDVVVDKLTTVLGGDFLMPMVTEYKPHAITKGFRLTSFFPIARSVRQVQKTSENLEVTEIAWTGPGSWAETDLKNLEVGKVAFDPKKDEKGPVPLAVAVQKKEGTGGRVVVFGDSDFVTNGRLNLSGNKDLFLNTIAWLSGDELAIAIRPRARKITPLYLKETDQEFVFYVPVLGLPLAFLLAGTSVVFWRRRFH